MKNSPIKFDVVLGNPPYQTKSDSKNTKTQAIWDKFVKKSFEICKEDGYVSLIHPSGWRNVDGMFKETKDLLQSKTIKYLSIHNADDGMKTFECATRYDWYIAQNNKSEYETTIKFENGEEVVNQINNLSFIPNSNFYVLDLVAKENEEKVNVLWDCSYHTQKSTMNRKKDDIFIHPCIQHINTKGISTCTWYSSINKGHFGIPKLIFSSRQIGGTLIDENGEFGTCQDCSSIVASKQELKLIKLAMDSEEFIELMKSCDFGGNRDRYPRKIIALFRKDFYKEFIDE
jgi:hypothetical protein